MEIKFNGTPGEVLMEVSDFLELKAPKQNLTPATAKAVTEVVIDTVKREAKAKLEKQATKKEAPAPAPKKEEAKPAEADMKPTPAPAPKKEEPKPADLRTLCANYCQMVPDGKARIKQWLTDKGYKKVSDIPEADLPEFKAMVNPADLITMCASYCQKVSDGKARIKQWLTDKGYKDVFNIPEADLPEFKALVNI